MAGKTSKRIRITLKMPNIGFSKLEERKKGRFQTNMVWPGIQNMVSADLNTLTLPKIHTRHSSTKIMLTKWHFSKKMTIKRSVLFKSTNVSKKEMESRFSQVFPTKEAYQNTSQRNRLWVKL